MCFIFSSLVELFWAFLKHGNFDTPQSERWIFFHIIEWRHAQGMRDTVILKPDDGCKKCSHVHGQTWPSINYRFFKNLSGIFVGWFWKGCTCFCSKSILKRSSIWIACRFIQRARGRRPGSDFWRLPEEKSQWLEGFPIFSMWKRPWPPPPGKRGSFEPETANLVRKKMCVCVCVRVCSRWALPADRCK